jgi:hypothetical protein
MYISGQSFRPVSEPGRGVGPEGGRPFWRRVTCRNAHYCIHRQKGSNPPREHSGKNLYFLESGKISEIIR